MNRTLSAVASLILLCSTLSAQSRPPKEVPSVGTVSGTVSTVSGSLITIMEGWVTIDATGATFAGRQGSASIADIKPGTRIDAAITNAGAGGNLQASRIIILDLPDGSLSAAVEAVSATNSTLTVLGRTIQVTSATRIFGGKRDQMTLADIKVGDRVTVEVKATASGLAAEAIHVQTPLPDMPRPDMSIDGTVKSIAADSWIITTRDSRDVTVLVNAQTKIEGSPKVGDTVHVIARSDAAGNIVALAISLAVTRPPAPPPSTGSFEGVVKSIGAREWLVDTIRVLVSEKTIITGAPVVGDTVRVTGTRGRDGSFLAMKIEKK